jgi:hypothetical protein
MKPSSIILNQDTTIRTVVKFLSVGNSNRQIRAKDLGNGEIRLYVRKDTFKQFFTDKLRLNSDVKRDYTKARNHILELVGKTDSSGKNLATILSIRANLPENKDGFYAKNSIGLHKALYPKDEISTLKDILEFGQSETNFEESILIARGDITETKKEKIIEWLGKLDNIGKLAAFLQNDGIHSEIINASNSIENTNDRDLFCRNFEALKLVAEYPSPRLIRQGLEPSIIDYKCAVDFFPAWQEATKAMNTNEKIPENNKLLNAINKTLTRFAEAVERKGLPENIDLSTENFQNSDADLVIFDESKSFTPFSAISPATSIATNDYVIENEDVSLNHNGVTFRTNTYPEKKVNADKGLTAGFGIFYSVDIVVNQKLMDSLYEKIEIAISKKIPQKLASSSKLMTEGNRADEIYTIHLPVLNPFVGQDLTPTEKTMVQTSFVKATEEWVNRYPNLRIKVQLSDVISASSIQEIYRNINKDRRTD